MATSSMLTSMVKHLRLRALEFADALDLTRQSVTPNTLPLTDLMQRARHPTTGQSCNAQDHLQSDPSNMFVAMAAGEVGKFNVR